MEFERLVSSLDKESLARTAEALLRALSGGAGGGTPSLPAPASAARREQRIPASLSLSEPGAARPLPGAHSAEQSALSAAGDFSALAAVPGGSAAEATEGMARIEARPGADAERKPRFTGLEAAEATARLEERLAAVSERNRRSLGAGAETAPPHASPDAPATDAAAAAEAAEPLSAFPARRAAVPGPGAEAVPGEADAEAAPLSESAAERDYFNAEALSEFFRRDSRRYDFGFSD